MRPLLKVIFILGIFFTSMLVALKFTGILTTENIKALLESSNNASPWLVAGIVIALMFSDLFVAVPTLTVTILAGYFLGPVGGALSVIAGLMLAGHAGYFLSWRYGEQFLRLVLKNESERKDLQEQFNKSGVIMILLSRALPMLPEMSACLAGFTRMKYRIFLAAWSASVVPYSFIAAYAGSISSFDNPFPAILAMIVLTSGFWVAWYYYQRSYKPTIQTA